MTRAAITRPAEALDDLMARVRITRGDVGERYPLFADPITGRWTSTRRGSWTAGYWTGLLWLRTLVTNEDADRTLARERTAALASHITTDTVTRGMTFWYGAASGDRLSGDPSARRIAVEGARALEDAWDPDLGIVPTGRAFGPDTPPVTIDGVVGLVPLLAWAARQCGDEHLHNVAIRHAERHLQRCLCDDGSIRAHPDVIGGRPARRAPAAHWARGQAWGMLVFTQAAQWLPGTHWLTAAVRAADWWLDHAPTGRSTPWDLDEPTGPVDTSADAIATVALQQLAAQGPPCAARYRDAAQHTLTTLIAHVTPYDAEDRRPRGMLLDGCYDHATRTAPAHELIWGSYFLAQALAIDAGLLAADAL